MCPPAQTQPSHHSTHLPLTHVIPIPSVSEGGGTLRPPPVSLLQKGTRISQQAHSRDSVLWKGTTSVVPLTTHSTAVLDATRPRKGCSFPCIGPRHNSDYTFF